MRRNLGKKPWFYPLPVLIIGTYDENGVPDAMNAAYGGLYTSNMVEFCISHDRKTFKNIMETKAFTVSFADAENMVPSDYVGLVSGNDTPDKMEKAGWTITPSEFVNAPLFEELPVTWIYPALINPITDAAEIPLTSRQHSTIPNTRTAIFPPFPMGFFTRGFLAVFGVGAGAAGPLP